MAEMYLTEKFAGHSMDHTSLKEELYDEALEDDEDRGEETKSQHSYETYTGIKPNIEELEMLLEAYFAQIDGISQKLFHVCSSPFSYLRINIFVGIAAIFFFQNCFCQV
ncbi:magnesium transporter MRS2-F-like [Camellia sinensis]|uniref:magnesium transporter MRS2-F-like n=1 Tax=Camellia sinensis TaxID=4442 RepID=UPI001036044E|nr:magnesium transporter MRS2-F-like [Camellia sinensis]